ncbi:MAG: AraC family transcriptional regulator [Chitinophagaceae bacterium]
MNQYIHSYLFSDPEKSFEKLGLLFDSSVENNTIIISEKKGQGILKKFHSDQGLCITTWNMQLRHPLYLERIAKPDAEKTFSLFYVFTDDNFIISGSNKTSGNDRVLKNMILVCGETNLRFAITPMKPVKVIEIHISKDWMASANAFNNLSSYSFYNILMNKTPVLFSGVASLNAHHSLSNAYAHINTNHPDASYISTKTISLLSDIFMNVAKRHETNHHKNDLIMEEKIILLEKIIDAHLDKNLPPINVIAKQLALSESTLKRNFKLLCGSTIYEYYLKKKMQKARELMDENPVTVKEVAYKLGYEKVSNFITMFKKYYEFSPGYLKKNSLKKIL